MVCRNRGFQHMLRASEPVGACLKLWRCRLNAMHAISGLAACTHLHGRCMHACWDMEAVVVRLQYAALPAATHQTFSGVTGSFLQAFKAAKAVNASVPFEQLPRMDGMHEPCVHTKCHAAGVANSLRRTRPRPYNVGSSPALLQTMAGFHV